ncbi:hypothetical protein [Mycobacterium sp.]|uniref:hypothetical protein n=1 Tax=Mycobacterium sp. TaxID=1785 RepID=UPI002C1EA666|nr:hypothetical protein [Mycobacterium sp.]HTY35130.1 hypothetical protein [Mycobacterium sp.]
MNGRQRRHARDPQSVRKIRNLQDRVEQTGKPGILHGLTGACRDCHATGEIVLLPGRRHVVGHIWHDEGCPAAAGVTKWQPEPI